MRLHLAEIKFPILPIYSVIHLGGPIVNGEGVIAVFRSSRCVKDIEHVVHSENLDPEIDLHPERWRFDNPDARDTFRELKERFRLSASAQTYYQREAYEGLVEGDVRITFDSHLLGLYPRERVTSRVLNDDSRRLMPDTTMILELKSTKGFPPWIYEGIKRAELRQQPIPKYTTAVKALKLMDHFVTGKYS